MTALPVYTAGTILPTASRTGKFQGTMAPATPRGVYRWMILQSSLSWRTFSGISMVDRLRAQMTAMPISCAAWPRDLPCSWVRRAARASLLASMLSAKAEMALRRSSKEVRDQVLNAVLAASTARSTSSWVERGTSGLGCLVAGLIPWRVSAVVVSSPLMTLRKVVVSRGMLKIIDGNRLEVLRHTQEVIESYIGLSGVQDGSFRAPSSYPSISQLHKSPLASS